MNNQGLNPSDDHQYSLKKILTIWALSAIPMGILAYVVTPQLATIIDIPTLIIYWIAIIVGLMWQFVLSVIILALEGYPLKWQSLKSRLRFQKPINPRTGQRSYKLLLWTLPFIILSAAIQSGISGIPGVDDIIYPYIDHLPVYDLSKLATVEFKGAWWILGLYLVTCLFNYFLGEELIYRGILLPKMNGVFGKWDWIANGVLFGLYHLQKPQIIISTALYFGLIFALPAKLFQSSWMAVIIHGLEGVLGLIMVLGIILGWM